MAPTKIPICHNCKSLPTIYGHEKNNRKTYRIKCIRCPMMETPWFESQDNAIHYWGVELSNNISIAHTINRCKKCKSKAELVSSLDQLNIENYIVRCSNCPARIDYARRSRTGVINTWNKLFGVANG